VDNKKKKKLNISNQTFNLEKDLNNQKSKERKERKNK
jgi:hypothetical protein